MKAFAKTDIGKARENNQDYLTIMYNNLELIKKELYKNS